MAYFGAIIGCVIESKKYAAQAADYNPKLLYRSIDALIAAIGAIPLLSGSFLVPKTTSFEF